MKSKMEVVNDLESVVGKAANGKVQICTYPAALFLCITVHHKTVA